LGLFPIFGELLPVFLAGGPNEILIALWGLFGALLGLAILAQIRSGGVGDAIAVAHS